MGFPILSGSDYFHLFIDKKMQQFGMAGNISRVHFEVDASTDLTALAERLKGNTTFQEVSAIRYKLRWPLPPIWKKKSLKTDNVLVTKNLSKDEFETSVLNREVNNEVGLVWIDLYELDDASKYVVISMHHVLFDHQGMMNFIHALNEDFNGPLFPEMEKTSLRKIISNTATMTAYMLRRSAWSLGSFLHRTKTKKLMPAYRIVQFSDEESKRIEQNAWKAGSRIGTSSFFISATAINVHRVLKERNENPPYLWFSVPHNQRKLGSKGHLVSNQLSFLFFRLDGDSLSEMTRAVSSLNTQLKAQLKNRITERYSDLMEGMRFVPLSIYAQMVDLTSRGKLSSFGYSDLGTDQLKLDTFAGAMVKSVLRYPPVPTPPGFNLASLRSDNGFQFIFGYAQELLTEAELDGLERNFKDLLLATDG